MKTLLLAATMLVLLGACQKSSVQNNKRTGRGLLGEWNYVQYFVSPGAGGQWNDVSPRNQKIEFLDNGHFVSAPSFLSGYDRYRFKDSITLEFSAALANIAPREMRFIFADDSTTLFLSPWNPACIEGCASKFTRH